MKTLFIRVEKRNANVVRLYLKRAGLLDTEKAIITEDDYILFPVKELTEDITAKIKSDLAISFDVVSREPILKKKHPRDLKEILYGKIPEGLLIYLPKSFDIIGDICIIDLNDSIRPYAKEVANAILQLHKNIKTVFLRAGDVEGTIRVRPLKFIAGELKTETVHRENGCTFHLDVTKVYFSPRLGREHWRVAKQVQDNEVVVDMFAGVGPYVIPAAKHVNALFYAIDINPSAYYYLKKNIAVNKLRGEVIPFLGDAATIIREKLTHVATRVIMNLPKHAHNYLDSAFLALSTGGGIIHFYSVGREPDIFESALKYVLTRAESENRKIKLLYKGKVKEIAPRKWQVVLDVKVY